MYLHSQHASRVLKQKTKCSHAQSIYFLLVDGKMNITRIHLFFDIILYPWLPYKHNLFEEIIELYS